MSARRLVKVLLEAVVGQISVKQINVHPAERSCDVGIKLKPLVCGRQVSSDINIL